MDYRLPDTIKAGTISKAYILFITVALLSACASTAEMKGLVIKRATFDMSYEKEQLKIVELGNSLYGVSGCGKKGTYIVECCGNVNIEACKAILNSTEAGRND